MHLTLGQIADLLHAEGDFDTAALALGYSIDSRSVAAGELFFAVRGDRVDGHDFVEAALANGALAAVVSMRWLQPPTVDAARLLRAPDEDTDCVLHALQQLARAVRRLWSQNATGTTPKRVVGITGSVGKTTTKECVAAALSAKFNVLKTDGNLNNHFGLPLQLLRLTPAHDIAVLEMGMNHAGEIRALAAIAEPDWGVVSNVAAVHLEFFPDGLTGIADAKRELIEALPPRGLAFLNADDDRVAIFAAGLDVQPVLFGTSSAAQVRASDVQDLGLEGTRFTVTTAAAQCLLHLHLPGRHNILNALAAVAVATAADVPLAEACTALETLRPTEKRGNLLDWNGARLINDTYNANPRALAAMVDALRSTPATRRIVVAGEMLELGPEGPALHHAAGAAMTGIDHVLGVRGLSTGLVAGAREQGIAATFVDTPQAAGEWLRTHLQPGDLVLLKASRGVRLERALEVLGPSAPPVPSPS